MKVGLAYLIGLTDSRWVVYRGRAGPESEILLGISVDIGYILSCRGRNGPINSTYST